MATADDYTLILNLLDEHVFRRYPHSLAPSSLLFLNLRSFATPLMSRPPLS